MAVKRVAVVRNDGVVDNVVKVDDKAEWPAPAGTTLVEDSLGQAEPGGSYADGVFTAAPRDEPPALPDAPSGLPQASVEQRLAALEADLAEARATTAALLAKGVLSEQEIAAVEDTEAVDGNRSG